MIWPVFCTGFAMLEHDDNIFGTPMSKTFGYTIATS